MNSLLCLEKFPALAWKLFMRTGLALTSGLGLPQGWGAQETCLVLRGARGSPKAGIKPCSSCWAFLAPRPLSLPAQDSFGQTPGCRERLAACSPPLGLSAPAAGALHWLQRLSGGFPVPPLHVPGTASLYVGLCQRCPYLPQHGCDVWPPRWR